LIKLNNKLVLKLFPWRCKLQNKATDYNFQDGRGARFQHLEEHVGRSKYQEFKQYPEPRMDGFHRAEPRMEGFHRHHSGIGAGHQRGEFLPRRFQFQEDRPGGFGIKKIGMLVDPSTEKTEMLVGSGTKMTEMLLDSSIKKTAILKLLYYIIKSLDMGILDSVMYSSLEIFFQEGSSIQIIMVVAGSKVFIHKGRILQRSTTDFTIIKMSTKTLQG
jgi:hypothetical protein